MRKPVRLVVCVLLAVMLVSQAICGVSAADAKVAGGNAAQPGLSRDAMYEWNLSKAYVVTEIDRLDLDGPSHIYTTQDVALAALTWDEVTEMHSLYSVKAFYGEEQMRLRALKENPDALIQYNRLRVSQSRELLSSAVHQTYEEFLEAALASGFCMDYRFKMDWEYRFTVDPGDIVIMAVDNVMEPWGETYAMVQPYPFTEDHTKPYIAKFIDGKLQLDGDIADAFTLYRLYDDTNPELTGIKDGDSIEDVVNFLKAVEQDMIRYEEEMK